MDLRQHVITLSATHSSFTHAAQPHAVSAAVHMCVSASFSAASFVLAYGVDLDVMDEQGNTALSSAAKARQHKAVSFLLQNRAKLNSECVSCWHPMSCLLRQLKTVS